MAPPPNSLSMATAALQRLVKEEASYHKELESQQKRVEKLEAEAASGQGADEEDNKEFILKQEVRTDMTSRSQHRKTNVYMISVKCL